jgi:hypothetical protein
MIEWEGYGNLLDDKGYTQLCPTNAMGAMGKGLAKSMRITYKGLFEIYRDQYHPTFSSTQSAYARATTLTVAHVGKISVLFFCTKVHWRDHSPIELVESNLHRLASQYKDLGIERLSMPMVGCGEGHLPFPEVRKLIHEVLGPIPLPIRLYLGT